MQARNKKSITLDLRTPEGQDIVLKLLPHVDVVLENFRPGTLEKWNLGFEAMKAVNPDVIFVRISGYGQNGPYRDRPGFGGIAEAMGGLRNLTGYPDRPPTRLGVSLGDSLAGMFGAIGALMALLHREHQRVQGRFCSLFPRDAQRDAHPVGRESTVISSGRRSSRIRGRVAGLCDRRRAVSV